MGLLSCTGGKLTKLSKLTCPSGSEPQCPGSTPGTPLVLLSAQLETRYGEGHASSLSTLTEALTEREKEGNFSLPLHTLAEGFVAVRMWER